MDRQKSIEQSIELFRAQARPPQEALKTIEFGRLKGKSDINPQWRIEALTETYGLYGLGWFVQIKDTTMVDLPETQEKMLFLTLELFVRDWSIPEDYHWFGPAIGIGGDYIIVRDKNGVHGNDEAYAMAMTDALGKAAKLFGVANDIYRGKYDTKYGWRDEKAQQEKRQELNSANWKKDGDNVYVLGQKGFVDIKMLSIEQLKAIVNFPKLAGIKPDMEKRIKELSNG